MMKKSSGTVTVLPRRKRGNFGIYKLTVIAGLVFMVLLLTVIGFQFVQRANLKKQLLQYQARIEEYETANRSTVNEIEKLQEYGYIELLARKYLGLVKPGETVFLLED